MNQASIMLSVPSDNHQLSLEFLFDKIQVLEKQDEEIKSQLRKYNNLQAYSQEFPGFEKKLSLLNDPVSFRLKKLGQYFTAKQWLEQYKQVILDDNEYRRFTRLISGSCLLDEATEAKTVSSLSREYKKKKNINQGSHIKIYEQKHHPILEQAYSILFESREKKAKYLGVLGTQENEIKRQEVKQLEIIGIDKHCLAVEINELIDFFIGCEPFLNGFYTNVYSDKQGTLLVVYQSFNPDLFSQYCKARKIELKNEIQITLEKHYYERQEPEFKLFYTEHSKRRTDAVDVYWSKRYKDTNLKIKTIFKKNPAAKNILDFLNNRYEKFKGYSARNDKLSPRKIIDKCLFLLELHGDVEIRHGDDYIHKKIKFADNKELNSDYCYSIFIDAFYIDGEEVQCKVRTLRHHPNYKKYLVVFGYRWNIGGYTDKAWVRKPSKKLCNYWENFADRINKEYNQLAAKYINKS